MNSFIKMVEKPSFSFAGVQGLGPQFFGPKPNVLPLDDTPIHLSIPFIIPNVHPFIFLTSDELSATQIRSKP
jgi:hypothetical protein